MKKNSKKLLLLLPSSFIFAPLSLISCSSNQKTDDNAIEDKFIESVVRNFQNIIVVKTSQIKNELLKIKNKINDELLKIDYEVKTFKDDYKEGSEQSSNINVKIVVVNNKDENKIKTFDISIKFKVIDNKFYDIQLSDIKNKEWRDPDAFIGVGIEIQPTIKKLVQNAPSANYYVWSYENKVIQEGSNIYLNLGQYIDQLGDVTFELQAFEDDTKKNLLGFGSRTYKITYENINDSLRELINGDLFIEFEANLIKPEREIVFEGEDFTIDQLKTRIEQIFTYVITEQKYKDDFELVWTHEPDVDDKFYDTENPLVRYKKASIQFDIKFNKYPKIPESYTRKSWSIKNFKVNVKEVVTVENVFANLFNEYISSLLNTSLDEYNSNSANKKITATEFINKNGADSTKPDSWKYYVDWGNNIKNMANAFGNNWNFVTLSEPRLINEVYDVPEQDGEKAHQYVVIKIDFNYKGISDPNGGDMGFVDPENVKDMEIIIKFV